MTWLLAAPFHNLKFLYSDLRYLLTGTSALSTQTEEFQTMSVLYSESHYHLQSHPIVPTVDTFLIEAFKNKQMSLFYLKRIDVEGITAIPCSPYYILFPAIFQSSATQCFRAGTSTINTYRSYILKHLLQHYEKKLQWRQNCDKY